jgi:hypothetical protein
MAGHRPENWKDKASHFNEEVFTVPYRGFW